MHGMKPSCQPPLQQLGSFHYLVATFLVIYNHLLLIVPTELLISHLFACHLLMDAPDRLGRKPVILAASVVFTIGSVVMGAADGKEGLLAGRIIVGVGIGKKKISNSIQWSRTLCV